MFTFIKKLFTEKKQEEIEVTPQWVINTKAQNRETITLYRATPTTEEEIGGWWSNYALPCYGHTLYRVEVSVQDLMNLRIAEVWGDWLVWAREEGAITARHPERYRDNQRAIQSSDIAIDWINLNHAVNFAAYNVDFVKREAWQVYFHTSRSKQLLAARELIALPIDHNEA